MGIAPVVGMKHSRRLICAAVAALFLGGVSVEASQGQGKGKQKTSKQKQSEPVVAPASLAVHVAFGTNDVTILRTHYAPRYRDLPPGLRKKVARGGQLPPGWQKKFELFPVVIERQLPVLPPDYRRGVIDAHAVIINSRTNVVVDVAVLF